MEMHGGANALNRFLRVSICMSASIDFLGGKFPGEHRLSRAA